VPRLTIGSRDLVRIGKRTLHPMMRYNVLDYDWHTGNPAYVLWLGPSEDLLIRCFHIHPVILRVQHENSEFWAPFKGTLDEEFLPRILRTIEDIYCVADSDEVAAVSLTPRDFPAPLLPKGERLDAQAIARWAEACAAPMHKAMFQAVSIWHEHEIEWSDWQPALARSRHLAEQVRWRLSMPDSVIEAEDPLSWLARKSRQGRVLAGRGGRGLWRGATAVLATLAPVTPGLLLSELGLRVVRVLARRRVIRNFADQASASSLRKSLIARVRMWRRQQLVDLQRRMGSPARNLLQGLPLRDLIGLLVRVVLKGSGGTRSRE
jgi:hypothetical protein